VGADEDEYEYFPRVDPVIADDIVIPGVDVAGPEALDEVPAPKFEIDDLNIPHDDPEPIEVLPAQALQMTAPVAPPTAPGLHRSTRV
jgi:hypothetical protein